MTARSVLFAFISVSLAAWAARPAEAGSIGVAVTSYSHSTGARSGPSGDGFGDQGGEFRVTSFGGGFIAPATSVTSATGALFHTFCLERSELLSGITQYELNDQAEGGGLTTYGGPNPDPLSEETARLFYTFWTDQWSVSADASLSTVDYDYDGTGGPTGTRTSDAEDLQLAIWFLENEIGQDQLTDNDNGQAQAMVDFVLGTGTLDAVTWEDLGRPSWTGIGDVRVLNTFDASGAAKQDLLVVVPLPASVLMGLALLGGLALVSFRKRRLAQITA